MKVLKIIGMGIFMAAMIALYIFIVMTLWNWIMPKIFGLTTLTYLETGGVILLCRLLFSGCGGKSKCQKKRKEISDKRWEKSLEKKLQHLCSNQKTTNDD